MVIRVECFGYFYRICMHTRTHICVYVCVHTCIFMCVSLYKTKPWIGSHCLLLAVQAQRRSREHSRSASALSLSGGDEKSEPSDGADQHLSYYSNGGFFATTTTGTRRTNMPFIHVYEGKWYPGHQARQFYNKQHTLYFPFVAGYKHAKTVELPQQRSSSVATQQTTVSSVPSHPSTAGVSSIDWLYWHTIPRLRQELNLSTYQRCTALEVSSSWWCMLHHADDVNPGLRTHWAEAWYKTRWRSNGFTEVG